MPDQESTKRSADNLPEAAALKKEEKLVRAIENLHFNEYLDIIGRPGKVFWLSFLKGVATGFGTIVGATVIVSLTIYIISLLGGVPVIGEWFSWLGKMMIRK